ncbi:MAG: amidohydrolase family protein [Bacillota bacterium]
MVIDVLSGTVPSKDAFRYEIQSIGRMEGYLEMFGAAAVSPKLSKTKFEELQKTLSYEDFVEALAEIAAEDAPSEADFIKMLDDAQVSSCVVYNEHYEHSLHLKPLPNEHVAEFVQRYPDRMIGLAGVDPWKGEQAVKEVERSVRELGLKGILFSPFKQRMFANDPKLYPVYAKCSELGVPVFMHCGINWWTKSLMDYGKPTYIDQVAGDFPSLKIVGIHGGWPWVQEAIFLAWRHPNVYLDISAHRPKFFTVPNSGWEQLLYFGNRTIQDKVMFGSTWQLLGIPIADIVKEVQELPLKDSVKQKWLHDNAARLFGL